MSEFQDCKCLCHGQMLLSDPPKPASDYCKACPCNSTRKCINCKSTNVKIIKEELNAESPHATHKYSTVVCQDCKVDYNTVEPIPKDYKITTVIQKVDDFCHHGSWIKDMNCFICELEKKCYMLNDSINAQFVGRCEMVDRIDELEIKNNKLTEMVKTV